MNLKRNLNDAIEENSSAAVRCSVLSIPDKVVGITV